MNIQQFVMDVILLNGLVIGKTESMNEVLICFERFLAKYKLNDVLMNNINKTIAKYTDKKAAKLFDEFDEFAKRIAPINYNFEIRDNNIGWYKVNVIYV